jgi:molecular chaperone DnaJ
MPRKRDYYEVLGVARNAGQSDVKRAFRRLARQYHPDVNPGDAEAEARFKEMAEAYEVLRDPDRRAQYDRYGHAAASGNIVGDFWDDLGGFGDLFEAFFGPRQGGRRPRVRRGADLRYDVEVTLEEVAAGAERVVRAERLQECEECEGTGSRSKGSEKVCPRCGGSGQVQHMRETPFGRLSTVTICTACQGQGAVVGDPCPRCQGAGRRAVAAEIPVTIPAGVDDGVSLRLEGQGEAGERGAAPGDLYVFIHVKPHEVFARRGRDLYCDVPIAFATAALGGKVAVPTLEEPEEVSIPAGTQAGEVFAVRGRGLPDVRTGVVGSLHARVHVVTPTKLTARQRELLAEYAREGGGEVEDAKGWFARLREALRGEDSG